MAIARELGLTEHVAFTPAPGAANVVVVLAMLGQGNATGLVASAAARGQACVASRAAVEGWEAPGWVRSVPDEPSPPLLAEAIAAAPRSAPSAEALEAFRQGKRPVGLVGGRGLELRTEVTDVMTASSVGFGGSSSFSTSFSLPLRSS